MNNWSDVQYLSRNSELIPQTGGVYRVLRNDGEPEKYTRIYVGKADDLRRRFLEHLAASEPNTTLNGNLYNYECYFRFVLLSREEDRTNVEQKLLAEFVPECNKNTE
jgi:excinuclease UvrABC nuclease subunit